MAAFEELGVLPELIEAVEEMGWTLPTPIQAEAVPLILGGGDVMASAETGAGKTGAFALPAVQIVHELLRARAGGGGAADAATDANGEDAEAAAVAAAAAQLDACGGCALNAADRDAGVALAPGGLAAQARGGAGFAGARAGAGGLPPARLYWEAEVRDDGLVRVGWAAPGAALDLGADKAGFGFGGTGRRVHARRYEPYGEPFGRGDVVGCALDRAGAGAGGGSIEFFLNGRPLGRAFALPPGLAARPLHPAVCLKDAEVGVNFGAAPFRHAPPPGFVGLAAAPPEWLARWAPPPAAPAAAPPPAGARAPLALVLAPSRELAEQIVAALSALAARLPPPAVAVQLVAPAGGKAAARAAAGAAAAAADILVGTPGRVGELAAAGGLALGAVRLLVLDEADQLLAGGHRAAVDRVFAALPKAGAGAARLQVLLFSATLTSPGVRALAAAVCQAPTLVDVRGGGREAVPDGVEHFCVLVDPREDRSWLQSAPPTFTDGVHAAEPAPAPDTVATAREAASEAAKRLKQRLLARLLAAAAPAQALVFCRTNHDCDQLARFLAALDAAAGGPPAHSCAVLGGAKGGDARRAALAAFRAGDARVLLATDVAARGVDVPGLPLVLNAALPERPEEYVHRVGRAGRAGAPGLAVSLVSAVPEKVWYLAGGRGPKPWLLPPAEAAAAAADGGGGAAWRDEAELLAAVERRLGAEVQRLPPDLAFPDGVLARLAPGGGGGAAAPAAPAGGERARARREAVAPVVAELAALERAAQASYFALRERWGGLSGGDVGGGSGGDGPPAKRARVPPGGDADMADAA